MSKKTITVCDGYDKELNSAAEKYHIYLKTDRFWNSVEMDWLEEKFEFCKRCAHDIRNTLHKINEKLNKGD